MGELITDPFSPCYYLLNPQSTPKTTTLMEQAPKTAVADYPTKNTPQKVSESFSIPIDSLKGGRFQVAEVKNQLLDKFQNENGLVTATTAKDIEELLKGRRSSLTVMNDSTVGKLYIANVPNNGPLLQQIDAQATLSIPKEYLGHSFTEKDRENLTRYANMGRPVELINQKTNQPYMAFVGVDKDLQKLVVLPLKAFHMPDSVKGVPLSPKQKQMLGEGKAIRLFDMTGVKGKFAAYVRIDAAKGSLRFEAIDNNKKAAFQKKDRVKPALTNKPADAPKISDATKSGVGQLNTPRTDRKTAVATVPPIEKAARLVSRVKLNKSFDKQKDQPKPESAPKTATSVSKPKKTKGVKM